MSAFIPKWEKSFVIVNKEERTGMVCYCFTVEQGEKSCNRQIQIPNEATLKHDVVNQQDSAEAHHLQQKQSLNVDVENLLSIVENPEKMSERIILDHKLTVFKGTLNQVEVKARLLQQNLEHSTACKSCIKDTVNREKYAQILQNIRHPSICEPLMVKCMNNSVLTIVSPYVKSIKDIIESRENLRHGNDMDARFICLCLTDAVMYLHEKLILHRDICPQNVFLDVNGNIILGNFEQATYTTELGVYMYGQCGTLGYQSPEVVAQLGYNHTVDYWGIGCVAYEFLFGIMPYADADVSRMLSKTVLNPDFAITRLGGRFNRLPRAAQEAFRDCFLNRYPHKRTGFKLHEAKQMRWFQPFRWDMVRNQAYESPLKKFVDGNFTEENCEAFPSGPPRNIDAERNLNTSPKGKMLNPRSPRWQNINRHQLRDLPKDDLKANSHMGPMDYDSFSVNICNENEKYEASRRRKQHNIDSKENRKAYYNNSECANRVDYQCRDQKKVDILPFINKMFSKENQFYQCDSYYPKTGIPNSREPNYNWYNWQPPEQSSSKSGLLPMPQLAKENLPQNQAHFTKLENVQFSNQKHAQCQEGDLLPHSKNDFSASFGTYSEANLPKKQSVPSSKIHYNDSNIHSAAVASRYKGNSVSQQKLSYGTSHLPELQQTQYTPNSYSAPPCEKPSQNGEFNLGESKFQEFVALLQGQKSEGEQQQKVVKSVLSSGSKISEAIAAGGEQ